MVLAKFEGDFAGFGEVSRGIKELDAARDEAETVSHPLSQSLRCYMSRTTKFTNLNMLKVVTDEKRRLQTRARRSFFFKMMIIQYAKKYVPPLPFSNIME